MNLLLNSKLNGLSLNEINLGIIRELETQAGDYGDIVKEERVEETLPLSFFSNNTTLIVPGAKKARVKGKDREVEINLTHFKNLVIWRSGNDPFICLEAWDNLPSQNGEEENFNTRSNTVKQEKSSTLQFESVFYFS